VFHRLNLAAHEETTTQLAGLYPFLAGPGLGAEGAYIGRDRYTQSAFMYNPFALYEAGILSNPNIWLGGVIGSGKSSLLKCMSLRFGAFGIRTMNPCDNKGEMVAMGQALGWTTVTLGPGHAALSPLYAPPKPAGWKEEDYKVRMEQHRLLLLTALAETASGRPLTAWENLLIELALEEVTRADGDVWRMRQPSLSDVVEVMMEPTPAMKEQIPSEFAAEMLLESRPVALRFRSMVRGSLRGVFDGEPVGMDLDTPGLVIDISRIRTSEAAMALTMTCGQAFSDLLLSTSEHRWLKVFDEVWRQIRYPAIVKRISEGQKLSRGDSQTAGSATVLAMHRITDMTGATAEARESALGLLADTSTRIVYNQAADQIDATAAALALTDVEASLLPTLQRGTGLWKIGDHSALVDHVVLPDGMEWPLIQTDSRMVDGYRSTEDPDAAMLAEFAGVAD
jgi:type IV secretory pathway VirB4 component